MATAKTIEDRARYSAALAEIADAREASGDHEAALKTIRMALSATNQIEDPESHAASAFLFVQRLSPALRRYELVIDLTFDLSARLGSPAAHGEQVEDLNGPVAVIDPAVAREALANSLQAARQLEQLHKRTWQLSQIAQLQLNMGDLDGALATAEEIEDTSSVDAGWPQLTGRMAEIYLTDGFMVRTGDRDRTLEAIGKAYGKSGRIDAMLVATDEIATPVIRVQALTRLASYFQAKRDARTARALIRAALGNSEQVEKDVRRSTVLAEISKLQADLGDAGAAVATARKIEDKGRRVDALKDVARALTASSPEDAAQDAENPFIHTLSFTALAGRHLEAHDSAATREAMRSALNAFDRIGDEELRLAALTRIGEIQTAIGDVAGLQRTLRLLFQMESAGPDPMSLSAAIAEAQANAGDFAAALASVDALDDAELRARTLIRIAGAVPN